jgi:hypothetical protein
LAKASLRSGIDGSLARSEQISVSSKNPCRNVCTLSTTIPSEFASARPSSEIETDDTYSYGFPNPPAPFTGTPEQLAYHKKQFERKAGYMIENKVTPSF